MSEDKKIARIYAPKKLAPHGLDDPPVGQEDDLPGLVAALKNERVVFDGKVIEPGADVIIENRVLFLSKRLVIRSSEDAPLNYVEQMAEGPFIEVRLPGGKCGRQVTLSKNILTHEIGDKKWLEEY